jgi:anaerobic magnesium-protoporphyrin IX monomethyl ester cyclase
MEADPWALGMRSISATLKQAGHESKCVFLRPEENGHCAKTLEKLREEASGAAVVGISSLARGSERAKDIIQCLRPLGPFIVWGGLHATLFPEDCVHAADVVCRGEGEGFILDLVERLQAGKDWRSIPNAAYLENGQMITNPVRPLVEDLDSLPLPDFSHADQVHIQDGRIVPLTEVFDVREPVMFNGSRGCQYPCTYCVNSKLQKIYAGAGRYCRKLSMPKYVENVRRLKELFPNARYAYLIDEDFLARKPEDYEYFASEFPKQVGLPFECMGSPVQCTERKINLLVKAGLWRVRVGLESGSERTKREIYKRRMPNEAIMNAARIIQCYPNVSLVYFFIMANPYEEKSDLVQTVRFLSELPIPYYSQVYSLVFFPGTLLYDWAVKDGLLNGKDGSGFELDYRSGLKYQNHPWKRKNLYLNALLFLTEGKATRHRMGLLPRCILRILLHPRFIALNERILWVARILIAGKIVLLKLRKIAARALQKLLKDPTSIYNLRGYFVRRLKASQISQAASAWGK